MSRGFRPNICITLPLTCRGQRSSQTKKIQITLSAVFCARQFKKDQIILCDSTNLESDLHSLDCMKPKTNKAKIETSDSAQAPVEDAAGYTTQLHVYALALSKLQQVGLLFSLAFTRSHETD